MTRKRALRRMKIKAAFAAAWEFVKGYLSFSKLLCYGVLLIDYKTTSTTLDLCYIAVTNNYTGSLPYLTALIALLQAATATVLSFALNKSKAENTPPHKHIPNSIDIIFFMIHSIYYLFKEYSFANTS